MGRTSTYLFLVILVGGEIELAIPGSAFECFTTEPNTLAGGTRNPDP